MTRQINMYESLALPKIIPDAMLVANQVTSLFTGIAGHFTYIVPVASPCIDASGQWALGGSEVHARPTLIQNGTDVITRSGEQHMTTRKERLKPSRRCSSFGSLRPYPAMLRRAHAAPLGPIREGRPAPSSFWYASRRPFMSLPRNLLQTPPTRLCPTAIPCGSNLPCSPTTAGALGRHKRSGRANNSTGS